MAVTLCFCILKMYAIRLIFFKIMYLIFLLKFINANKLFKKEKEMKWNIVAISLNDTIQNKIFY